MKEYQIIIHRNGNVFCGDAKPSTETRLHVFGSWLETEEGHPYHNSYTCLSYNTSSEPAVLEALKHSGIIQMFSMNQDIVEEPINPSKSLRERELEAYDRIYLAPIGGNEANGLNNSVSFQERMTEEMVKKNRLPSRKYRLNQMTIERPSDEKIKRYRPGFIRTHSSQLTITLHLTQDADGTDKIHLESLQRLIQDVLTKVE